MSDVSATAGQRDRCAFCQQDRLPAVESASVPSNVRRFRDERFTIWRCPECRTLHCLEVVELNRYYDGYPIGRKLTGPNRVAIDNLRSRLTKHGFSPESSLLDYGCGRGLFGERARECGFPNVVGYDPYSDVEEFRHPGRLTSESFDFVLLQDVIEHVEDPRVLLSELNGYLKPGGFILIGTPNADDISLDSYESHWLELHPPYHLHIYTRAALSALGAEIGWREVDYFDRSYYDTKTPGLNMRALLQYQRFGDGTLDALSDPVPRRTMMTSPAFMFFLFFGYCFKRRGEMTVVFTKPRNARRA